MNAIERHLIRTMAKQDKLERELFRARGTINALQQEVDDLKAVLVALDNAEIAEVQDPHVLETGARTGCDASIHKSQCSICGK